MPTASFDLDAYLDAMERLDLDAVLGFMADDIEVEEVATGHRLQGKARIAELMSLAVPAMGPMELDVLWRVKAPEGHDLALLVHARGTYEDDIELHGQRLATGGKSIDMKAAVFLHIDAQGRIDRIARVRDMGQVMQQLGIPPEQLMAFMEGVEASPTR